MKMFLSMLSRGALGGLALCVSAALAQEPVQHRLTDGDALFRDGLSTLAENPGRGAAPGWWHVLKKSGNEAGSPSGFCSWLWNIGAFSGGNEYKGKTPPPGVIGGEDLPLTEDALLAVSNTLVNARDNGAIMIVRFGYTSSNAA